MLVESDSKSDENGNSEVVIVSSAVVQSTAGPTPGLMTSPVVGNSELSSPPPAAGPLVPLDYVHSHSGPQAPDASDTKEGIEELCPVCGDKVSGYHYGLLTCESCKGFFKRTVQNKKVYTCVADRSCHIDKSQRKRCPYCRFQKCLDVGMKLEAVRADRMRGGRNKFGPMYKRDRARRLQIMRQKQLVRTQCLAISNGSDSCDQQQQASNALTFPSSQMSSPSVYGDSSGVKQELIQIPQLSSSTSSPGSSPSPLNSSNNGIVATLGHPFGGTPSGQIQILGSSGPGASPISGAGESGKQCWAPSSPQVHSPNSPKAYHHGPLVPSTHHEGGGQSSGGTNKVPPLLLREFQMSIMDEKEWQSQLFGLLQNQSYNQCEVDLFELMCKVIDQSLFGQVDWARNSIFFKDLKVDDQMKLLQHSWSDMLILDHLHQRLHHGLPDETTLANGQKFDLLTLALLGQPSLAENLHRIASKLQELKFDPTDYICLKFLLLLNPEVRGLSNMKLVHDAHEQAQQTLLDYTISCYPQISDKFGQMLQQLPEIHLIGMRGEEFLYFRHLSGSAPTQTLLMEMLHAKKK